MKKFIYSTAVLITMLISCEPQQMETGKIGPAPINAAITTNATDPHNPIFTAHADNGYIFQWDMGNGQTIAPGANTATSYYPFVGTYTVGVTIYGEGAQEVLAETSYKVTKNDPEIAKKPVWKELTGGGTILTLQRANPTIVIKRRATSSTIRITGCPRQVGDNATALRPILTAK